MYIERAQLPVFGAFGAEDSGDLPVGSRIMVPAGTVLKARGAAPDAAEKPWNDFTLPEDTEARVMGVTGVSADGMVIGRDVVSVGASVTVVDDTRIGGAAHDVAARSLKDSSSEVDVVLPHGTRVTILEVASASAPVLPGVPGGAPTVSSQERSNAIWAKRAIAGTIGAGLAATLGVAGTATLAVTGRRKAAIAVGVVGFAAVVAGVTTAVYSARRIVRPAA